jgi:uncharacterized MnhB-related membrane protein
VSLPKFRRLGDTGPIIISHEEITCCYLVKSKSVLVTDISANFTAKMIRYLLMGAYSFIMANVWLQMGSCDVAFTEAAVGAGASTALMMACLSRVPRWEKK